MRASDPRHRLPPGVGVMDDEDPMDRNELIEDIFAEEEQLI